MPMKPKKKGANGSIQDLTKEYIRDGKRGMRIANPPPQASRLVIKDLTKEYKK